MHTANTMMKETCTWLFFLKCCVASCMLTIRQFYLVHLLSFENWEHQELKTKCILDIYHTMEPVWILGHVQTDGREQRREMLRRSCGSRWKSETVAMTTCSVPASQSFAHHCCVLVPWKRLFSNWSLQIISVLSRSAFSHIYLNIFLNVDIVWAQNGLGLLLCIVYPYAKNEKEGLMCQSNVLVRHFFTSQKPLVWALYMFVWYCNSSICLFFPGFTPYSYFPGTYCNTGKTGSQVDIYF